MNRSHSVLGACPLLTVAKSSPHHFARQIEVRAANKIVGYHLSTGIRGKLPDWFVHSRNTNQAKKIAVSKAGAGAAHLSRFSSVRPSQQR